MSQDLPEPRSIEGGLTVAMSRAVAALTDDRDRLADIIDRAGEVLAAVDTSWLGLPLVEARTAGVSHKERALEAIRAALAILAEADAGSPEGEGAGHDQR